MGIDRSEKNTGGIKKSHQSKLHSLDRPPSTLSDNKNSFSNVKKRIVYPAISHPLIPVRLKSGEILKISKPVFCRLRDLSRNDLLQPSSGDTAAAGGIEIQSVTKPNIVHVPFTDRLSGALGKLNHDSLHESKSKPVIIHGRNGRITKTVKLRAALDKSTVAWASTTRLKPKTSLLDQLNSLTYITQPPSILPQTKKSIIPTVPSSSPLKSPVVIKLKPKISKHEMTTLSNALKKIEQNEFVPNGVVNVSSNVSSTQSKNFFDSYISSFDTNVNCKATSFQKP